jgi:hypothetical protein
MGGYALAREPCRDALALAGDFDQRGRLLTSGQTRRKGLRARIAFSGLSRAHAVTASADHPFEHDEDDVRRYLMDARYGGSARCDHKMDCNGALPPMTPRSGAGLLAVTVAGQFRDV